MIKAYLKDWANEGHWATRYNKRQADKIVRKLARHFKVRTYATYNTNRIGHAHIWSGRLELPRKDISLGMICHEVGHILAYKHRERGHSKKVYKYILRVYRYAIKYIPTELLLRIDKRPLLEYKRGEDLNEAR